MKGTWATENGSEQTGVWGANTPPQLRRALSGGAGEKQPEKSRREAGEKTEIAEREEWWLDDANEG